MFMSMVNCVVENHAAAIRTVGLLAFCSALTSEVKPVQVSLDCPDGIGVTYDGLLARSPITLYPSLPYTPFQVPCVAESVLTNAAAPGEDVALFVSANVTAVSPGAEADTL
jgi:hypothetical protein